MLEDHWERIAARVAGQIRREAPLPELGKLPESELRQRAHDILCNLGRWLTARDSEDLAQRYEELGRRRSTEGVPLHELVYALQIIKEQMITYVREEGLCQSTVELYAEAELLYVVNLFFDRLIYHVVRGYERAMRGLSHAAAR